MPRDAQLGRAAGAGYNRYLPRRGRGARAALAAGEGQHHLATRPSTPQLHTSYTADVQVHPTDNPSPASYPAHTYPDDYEEDEQSTMTHGRTLRKQSSRESLLSTSSSGSDGSHGAIRAPPSPDRSSSEEDRPGLGLAVPHEEGARELATPHLPVDGEGAQLGWKGWAIRALALLCACALSVGSHYAQYFLGPIKSRLSRELNTSNAQFSLLLASFSLNNTWTPLLGGLLTARLGTAWSSVLATSLIFFGQLILLLGDWLESVRLMALGLFVFGLGISPLAVVQETIIVRFFSSHGLGISLALGLLAGKGASFVSAITSFPLSERFGPHAPFLVATLLAGFSWGVNLVYLGSSAWFARGAGVGLEEGEARAAARRAEASASQHLTAASSPEMGVGLRAAERMSEAEALRRITRKRRVRFGNVARLGDVFWAYVGINVLCGAIWAPFMHLSANIIERRYGLTEADAGNRASLLMSGAIVLYPICGYLTDRLKTATVVHKMFVLSSLLTMVCYGWLCLPPDWTRTPTPALVAFGTGQGFATLLLVIIVPHLVPIKYVSSALGVHKALEQTGSTICQTLAGLLLDRNRAAASLPPASPTSGAPGVLRALAAVALNQDTDGPDNLYAISVLLRCFLAVNVLHFVSILGMWRLQVVRDSRIAGEKAGAKGYTAIPAQEEEETDDVARPSAADDEEVGQEQEQGHGTFPTSGRHRTRTLSGGSTRPLLSKPHPPEEAQVVKRQSSRGKMMAHSRAERARGRWFMLLSAVAIGAAWVLFMAVAWEKLDEKAKRK